MRELADIDYNFAAALYPRLIWILRYSRFENTPAKIQMATAIREIRLFPRIQATRPVRIARSVVICPKKGERMRAEVKRKKGKITTCGNNTKCVGHENAIYDNNVRTKAKVQL